MPFVMVPVPEEHVVEVMLLVARLIQRASIKPWDQEAAEQVFRETDEAGRSLLSVVARSTAAGKLLSDERAAEMLQLTVRDVLSIMRDVNDRGKALDRPQMVGLQPVAEVLPDGLTTEGHVFTMADDVARMLRAAERVVQTAEPHPLEPELVESDPRGERLESGAR